ncbi:hypothetical protein HIM_07194 [Hirsutella minnesotensis 3608]|uniref:Endonuclease/exonuclease/phosphatase domain-containing protein n=1 Tax=Hirsutella minnesotensis 3608 TaxID=1043627 RepID=A0A0F7ZNA3_9HYPO|nr:hypothetical protein HIM_07194 [Hirsutella minnesotensis 3608]
MKKLAKTVMSRSSTRRAATAESSEPEQPSNYQKWHSFDGPSSAWVPVEAHEPDEGQHDDRSTADGNLKEQVFGLVTWNIDGLSAHTELRARAVVSHMLSLGDGVDVIFLQEVSRAALSCVLGDERVRRGWLTSDVEPPRWHVDDRFGTLTLLSKRRLGHDNDDNGMDALVGPVWSVSYKSFFGRDALCCDVLVRASSAGRLARVRLVNVHLDSLGLRPSCRPHQVGVVAGLLRGAGRGLVAGDFNPVLPEDATLVEDNGLDDAWVRLRGGEPGATWGGDGKREVPPGRLDFPPGRLDKIAMVGLDVRTIEILHPGTTSVRGGDGAADEQEDATQADEQVEWSDHCGLMCTFAVADQP